MTTATLTIEQLVAMRNTLAISQKELYITAATNINMRNRELLKNDFGSTLAKNCAWEASEAIISYIGHRLIAVKKLPENNKFVNDLVYTSDYYVSVQQIYDRIMNFSYDDADTLGFDDKAIRKMLYETKNGKEVLEDIAKSAEKRQTQLFTDDRSTDSLDREKKKYRERLEKTGPLTDDITGAPGQYSSYIKNGKEVEYSQLHADHKLARESIAYDPQYARPESLDERKRFYNSPDNFWLIDVSANTAKGDVRVCRVNGKVVYMSGREFRLKKDDKNIIDITSRASAEQLAEATIYMWGKETPTGNKLNRLKEIGYLDEDGKVLPETQEKLEQEYRNVLNKESLNRFFSHSIQNEKGETETHKPWDDYKKYAEGALNYTQGSVRKIIIGQIIYYVLPPVIYETKNILRKKNVTLKSFFKDLKKRGERIIQYVKSKLGAIFKAIIENAFNKFIKTFFDLLLDAAKETVKHMLKIVKQLVMTLVNCVRIIVNKDASFLEKADAITKTLSITISSCVLEWLFETAEKKFHLPDLIMEPLQIIVTILVSNLIMLILQEADLFDVKYGLLVSNMDKIFTEEKQSYEENSEKLFLTQSEKMEEHMRQLERQIDEIQQSISTLNLYEEDITDSLNKINEIFDMGIDFDSEWQEFNAVRCGGV